MLDFQALKAAIAIESTFDLLGLRMKREGSNGAYRGACPSCQSDNDRTLVVTPAKRSYYCFHEQKGGDVIALAAHIKGIGMKDAAVFLANSFATPPQEPRQEAPTAAKESKTTLDNVLTPLTYLAHQHEAVQQLGFSEPDATAIGCGYCSKGMMRGRIAVPIRSNAGKLLGYIGLAPGCDVKLPPSFRF